MKFTDTVNLPGRRPGGNGPANHAEVRCAIELNIDLRALALGKLADGAKAIMTFRHGSTLVSLEALTDEEIQHALPCEKRTLTRAPARRAQSLRRPVWRTMEAQARGRLADRSRRPRARRAPAAPAPQHARPELAGFKLEA